MPGSTSLNVAPYNRFVGAFISSDLAFASQKARQKAKAEPNRGEEHRGHKCEAGSTCALIARATTRFQSTPEHEHDKWALPSKIGSLTTKCW